MSTNTSINNFYIKDNITGLRLTSDSCTDASFQNFFFENSQILQNHFFLSNTNINIKKMILIDCFMNYSIKANPIKTMIYFVQNTNLTFENALIGNIFNYTESFFFIIMKFSF